jgi:ElaB/YqjD/DUF883 family membrane-anchored ribosome-binding protein
MLNINEKTIDAYKQKTRAQMKEMQAKMQVLEAGAEKAGADMRIKYQKYLDDWKSRFDDIEVKLDKLSNSSEDAWDNIRSGIDTAMNELGDAINKAKEQLKN